MHFFDLFSQLLTKGCIALLTGYLAFSGFAASSLQHHLARLRWIEASDTPLLATADTPTTPQGAKKSSFTYIPSRYTIGDKIPRILLDNLPYQEAAVAGAGSSQTKDSTTTTDIKDALVNIFCTYREGKQFNAITGSGAFIDSKGIILTNAHVAQFLLLTGKRENAQCVIRQGNPAEEKYVADLLYISPAWIHENAALITSKKPSGTGERDYALLYVTKAIKGPLPPSFPALKLNSIPLTEKDQGSVVLAAGYPADMFSTEGPRASLVPKVANTTISQLFTFGTGDADVMALHDSVVGEHGSSGGPILTKEGVDEGLIVTRGDEKDGAHSLHALTLSYINKTIREETGYNLATTLEGNISRRSEIFKKALVPFLTSLLESELH